MQILYLIGNGFDINLNMKTRYTEFYEHYPPQRVLGKAPMKSSANVSRLCGILFNKFINYDSAKFLLF